MKEPSNQKSPFPIPKRNRESKSNKIKNQHSKEVIIQNKKK